MTKAKLARLIKLSNRTALHRPDGETEELKALQAEFAAWEPEALISQYDTLADWLLLIHRREGRPMPRSEERLADLRKERAG